LETHVIVETRTEPYLFFAASVVFRRLEKARIDLRSVFRKAAKAKPEKMEQADEEEVLTMMEYRVFADFG
jgi:hypothetical protein